MNIETSLDMAFQAYNQNKFETAEELVRDVLTIAPANGDALYLLGLIAYRSNALEPAEKLLYEAVKLYPDSAQYALALAGVLQKAGRLDEALTFYEKYKETALVLSQIGYIYLQKGQDDFARSAFQKALEKEANCLNAHIGTALLARREGENTRALQILNAMADVGQNDAEFLYQTAIQNRLCGQYEEALSAIEKSLNILPTASSYNEKGLILESLNRLPEAQNAYETAIESDSYAADAYANLGNLYLKAGNYRRAEDSYKRALALDADFLNAHHNLAIALCKQNRKAEGLEHYRAALLINPHHISGLYNLAMILEEMGDYSEAAGLYFNILTLKQQPAGIEFRIANTLAALWEQGKKSRKEALDFAKGWVKHFPESDIAQHTLNALTHNKKDDLMLKKYVESLFDAFADTYDETMEHLSATALQTAADYLNETLRDDYGDVLDLACGTGYFCTLFHKKYNTLTGVDISEKMLAKARLRNCYTQLVRQDIFDFLKADEKSYHLILGVELTPYLADLKEMMTLVMSRLRADGLFLLSIETTEKEDIYLSAQGRYLYRPEYVENLLKQIGFSMIQKKDIFLRKEGQGQASGVFYVCRKTAI